MKTTLNKIRSHAPCIDGWRKLLSHLGKTEADDEPLSIITILDSNGLEDALWCLRAVDGCDRELRLYAVWCTRRVQRLIIDDRSLAALDVAERHAHGKATDAELNAASDAAFGAAWEASEWGTTWDAASDAAWATASSTAWGAAWDAPRDAVRAAASAAADAAIDEAWPATALNVTWAAERDAVRAAARSTARRAEWDAQSSRLREVCAEIAGK